MPDEQLVVTQPIRDFYLDVFLSALVAQKGASATLTLTVGGSVVSGLAISLEEWEETWLDQLEQGGVGAMDTIRESFRELAEQQDGDDSDQPPKAFINMKDVTVYNGGDKIHLPLWRGRLDAVSAWSMGTLSA